MNAFVKAGCRDSINYFRIFNAADLPQDVGLRLDHQDFLTRRRLGPFRSTTGYTAARFQIVGGKRYNRRNCLPSITISVQRLLNPNSRCGLGCLVAGGENDHPQGTELIDKRMNLAVGAALGDADCLFRRPPFPPPAAQR